MKTKFWKMLIYIKRRNSRRNKLFSKTDVQNILSVKCFIVLRNFYYCASFITSLLDSGPNKISFKTFIGNVCV